MKYISVAENRQWEGRGPHSKGQDGEVTLKMYVELQSLKCGLKTWIHEVVEGSIGFCSVSSKALAKIMHIITLFLSSKCRSRGHFVIKMYFLGNKAKKQISHFFNTNIISVK